MAEQYGMKADDIKKHISDTDKKNIEDDLKVQKAVDYIMDNAKFVEKSADSEKKTEEN
jgi:trigger factor